MSQEGLKGGGRASHAEGTARAKALRQEQGAGPNALRLSFLAPGGPRRRAAGVRERRPREARGAGTAARTGQQSPGRGRRLGLRSGEQEWGGMVVCGFSG